MINLLLLLGLALLGIIVYMIISDYNRKTQEMVDELMRLEEERRKLQRRGGWNEKNRM